MRFPITDAMELGGLLVHLAIGEFHNPENVKEPGEGFRFLYKREVEFFRDNRDYIKLTGQTTDENRVCGWLPLPKEWSYGPRRGDSAKITYRTRGSTLELLFLRGLVAAEAVTALLAEIKTRRSGEEPEPVEPKKRRRLLDLKPVSKIG